MKKLILVSLLALLLSPNLITYADDYIDNNATRVINYQWVMSWPWWVPITVAKTFRFSIWADSNYFSTDILPDWSINTSNPNFTWYYETQTVTPDVHWNFVTQIWSIIKLPYLDYNRHKFLQVEIKSIWAPDTSYELLDVDEDQNNSTDRRIFTSSPYTINPNTQTWSFEYEVWTQSWNLALLWQWDKFNTDLIFPFTNENTFTINKDDSTWEIKLAFWSLLNKILKWSDVLNRFELWDSLHIWWNLSTEWNNYLWSDLWDSTEIKWTLNITWTWLLNWRNLGDYLDKIDTIEWNAKDDQASYEVPFSATWFNSTNVKEAILELQTNYTDTDDQTADEVNYITSTWASTTVASFLTNLYNQVLNNVDTDDQVASQVPFTPASWITSTNVQSAIEELKNAGFVDTDDQVASEVNFTPSWWMTSTTVQTAILEAYNNTWWWGWTDDQIALEVPFTPIPWITSTNVQSAISDLNNKITISMSNTESYFWSYFPWTESGPKNTMGHEKAVPIIMTNSWIITSIWIVTNPGDSSPDWEFVITKNDDWIYDSLKVMTNISQLKTWAGDANNSSFSNNPTSWAEWLSFSPWDILRAYHVWTRDSSSSLIIKTLYQ